MMRGHCEASVLSAPVTPAPTGTKSGRLVSSEWTIEPTERTHTVQGSSEDVRRGGAGL